MTEPHLTRTVQPPPRWRSLLTDLDAAAGEERFPPGWVTLELDEAGVPGLQAIEFTRPATAAQMSTVPWQRVIDRSVAWELANQYFAATDPGWATRLSEGDLRSLRLDFESRARRLRPRRNRITEKLLTDVAAAYGQSGGSVDAVAERFMVSRRQADRYVARAREAGKLP